MIIKTEICNDKNDNNISELNINKQILTNPFDIASAFNDYFVESTHRTHTANSHVRKIRTKTPNTMFLRPMAEDEVKKEIMSVNNTTSEGFDGISTKILKYCVEELSSILTYLINLSFSSGTFPELLKKSIVKPL